MRVESMNRRTTDFSDGSLDALAHATDIALNFGAEICLVHVIPILPALPTDPNLVFNVLEYERLIREQAQRHLNDIAHELTEKGIRAKTFVMEMLLQRSSGSPSNKE
jgi:nucleotide-binding universal stress UspA family protein